MAKSRELRPTSEALQHTLTRLAGVAAAVGLVWLAMWVVQAPPEGIAGPWLGFGTLACLLAVPCVFAAWKPESPAAAWLPPAATGVTFAALAWIYLDSGLLGWWRTTELAALVVLVTTLALPTMAALLVELAVLVGVAIVLYQGTVDSTVGAGTVVMSSAGVRLLLAATAVWLANALLRSTARRTDALLRLESAQRELLATEEGSRRSDRSARRFLHDSGMNSLEAISRGLPDVVVPALRERCAEDAQRWLVATTAITSDTESAFQPALAEAAMRGLHVHCQFEVDGRIPNDPLEALVSASAEALRNVAKHADVDSASMHVQVTDGVALVSIDDTGRGLPSHGDRPPPGLGIEESIKRRMADVGGTGHVAARPAGGTQVTLRWPAAIATSPVAADPSTGDMGLLSAVVKVAWIAVGVTAVGAVVSTAVNWWSVESPWLLAIVGMALAATGAWLLTRWRRGLTDSYDVAVASAAVALATAAMPVADPFCSAASGPALLPDGRLLIVVIIGVLLASWRATLTVLAATSIALAAAGALWHIMWPMCVAQMLPNSIGLAVVALASVALGRALRMQEDAQRSAFDAAEAATLELARQRADDLVREQWSIATVNQARELLRQVADPTTDPNDPTLRKQAGDTAARLRAVVRARELPGHLGTVLTSIVEAGRSGEFPVTIEGDLAVEPDPIDAGTIAGKLGRWWKSQSGAVRSVTVTLATFAGVSSLLVCIETRTNAVVQLQEDQPDASPSDEHIAQLQVDSWSEAGSRMWRAQWSSTPANQPYPSHARI